MTPLPSEQQEALWEDAATAAALLSLLGHAAGGVLLRARPGPVRDHWLAEARRLQPADAPWRKVPLHCAVDRLLGGLNLTATLRSGRPVAEKGLLAECHGGVALLAMAERAESALLAPMGSVLDTGELRLEREGVAAHLPALIAIVALDEGVDDEEALDESLAERLALRVDLNPLSIAACGDAPWTREDIAAARQRLPSVQLADQQLDALCAACIALGVASPRASIFAGRIAVAHAALHDRQITEDDIELALRLVLLPRATQLPATQRDEDTVDTEDTENRTDEDEQSARDEDVPPDAPAEDPPDQLPELPPDSADPGPDEQDADTETDRGTEDMSAERLVDAACAALPDALLEQLVARALKSRQSRGGGKSGATQRHKLRGRPMGSIAGDPRTGARLDLIATLRAAAPWQKLRQRSGGARVHVDASDFRVVRFRQRTQSVTVFVVDASGSSALYRLAEAKGAVELLLADCYVRRDEVALIVFRGEGAEVLLPPTRSLVRAKRSLSALPGGGGTPLAAAIDATALMIDQIVRRGATPAYVMLTDGRANISRDGTRGREVAMADALAAASQLRAGARAAGMIIDTSPRPHRAAAQLAEALDALYLPLPQADASQLRAAVRGATS